MPNETISTGQNTSKESSYSILSIIKRTVKIILPNWVLSAVTHAGFYKHAKNMGWLFFGKMIGLIISFFVGIYIARYLGPGSYGTLSYVVSFVGLFAFLSDVGIDGILNRELIKYPGKENELLGSGLFIKITGSLAAIIVAVGTSFIITSNNSIHWFVFLFSITFVFQAFDVIDLYFQSRVLSKKTIQVQIISAISSACLKIAFIFLKLDVVWFLLSYVFDSAVLCSGLVISYTKNRHVISQWHADKNTSLSILKDSWPMMLASVAIAIYSRIDQVMIKNFMTDEAVGLYSAAVRLSEMWFFVPQLVCSSVFPAIINSRKTDPILYRRRMGWLYSFMFWLAVAIAIPISFFSHFIIGVIFGAAYLASAGVLRVYVWAGISVFLGTAIGQYLVAENFTKIYFIATFSGAVINIILNLVLISHYGIIGAAIATLISYSWVIVVLFLIKKTRSQGILVLKAIIFKHD